MSNEIGSKDLQCDLVNVDAGMDDRKEKVTEGKRELMEGEVNNDLVADRESDDTINVLRSSEFTHDGGAKLLTGNRHFCREIVSSLCSDQFPEVKNIDWDSFRKLDTQILTDKWTTKYADSAFAVSLRDYPESRIIIHFEFQSKPDRLMPFRLDVYASGLANSDEEFSIFSSTEMRPGMLQIVIYTGSEGWNKGRICGVIDSKTTASFKEFACRQNRVFIDLGNYGISRLIACANIGTCLLGFMTPSEVHDVERLIQHLKELIRTTEIDDSQKRTVVEYVDKYAKNILGINDLRSNVDAEEVLMDLRSRIEASYKRIAQEAKDEGIVIGIDKGIALGRDEGIDEGIVIGRVDSIKDIMDLRFGGMPDESLAALREINDVAVMRSIQNAAVTGDKDEVLNLIAQSRPA